MLYVLFVGIFAEGVGALTCRYRDYWGHWVNAASFFGGMVLIGAIDRALAVRVRLSLACHHTQR